MRKYLFLLPLLLFIPLALGQLDSNSVTVTVSRAVAAGQPDQELFNVSVQSSLTATFDDIIGALQGSGITAANFFSLGSQLCGLNGTGTGAGTCIGTGTGIPGDGSALTWSFQFAAPFAKAKDTLTMLSALQQSIAKKKSGLSLSFSLVGTQVSAQAQPTCSLTDLVADARSRAQSLASAGSLSVGNILAMSSPTPVSGVSLPVATLGALSAPSAAPVSCSLTVKFALVRF